MPRPADDAPEVDLAAIPTTGVVCAGRAVLLGWPEPEELDRITALRNSFRKWYLDDRPLDPETNRRWLTTGLRRPYESLLSIRWKGDGTFLGTIGWFDWDPVARSAAFGRLMADVRAARRLRPQFPSGYEGVGLDAARAIYAFGVAVMGVRKVSLCFLEQNRFVRRISRSLDFIETGRRVEERADGKVLVSLDLLIPEGAGGR